MKRTMRITVEKLGDDGAVTHHIAMVVSGDASDADARDLMVNVVDAAIRDRDSGSEVTS